MKLFGRNVFTKIFALATGLIFLNMSFFLAEVCLLDFQDKEMIENVSKLILNGGLEEERDTHGATSGPGVDAFKVLSLEGDSLLLKHSSLFLIAARTHSDNEDHYRHADHSEIVSPPPEYSVRVA